MQDFTAAFAHAVTLVASGDRELLQIVLLSLRVSLSAVALACLIGMPLGAALAVLRFPGRRALALVLNASMGLPPVVVGLLLYMAFSRAGPLSALGLLYTPTAMIVAQTVLVTPIVAALSRSAIAGLMDEFDETLRALRASRGQRIATLLWEARPALLTAALAGMGRAFAEVGAVMIVGGNIDHVTRVMTTAIALETSRGELALALALGLVLVCLSLALNAAALGLRPRAYGVAYAR
ncbi:sulfate/tungstate uptake family ABC transporter, permease protein [Oceanicola granulosus HTCC2516]|uniref:Sulfate/tungstate uptake family ABC transporter, permease protein n=1 Tax=Oceanicola granulosus (strain ATCC BAA-861 / DSM 15982 / KCTC 12143 / HTCC2516) TaxID=314256 RepID=Q2CHY4_OCEGH|nr:ABC transporter permease [Oceanicola granulosus]EAR52160.1 sulfate/tungstate uptake family ABC transporter, permease protein [Oceanicola granulosus HTCC2516]